MTRYFLPFFLLLALLPAAHAQMGLNSPRGITPTRDMEIYSRDVFLVQQKYIPTSDPISGTYTLSCAANPPDLTATAGVLLDPGGTSNYSFRHNCTQLITTPGNPLSVGYELTFTQLDTDVNGDSVIIGDVFGGRIAFSGNELPPMLLVLGHSVKITFKTDTDSNVGAGFVLRWRRVSMDPPPTDGDDGRFDKSLQFDLRTGALIGGLNAVGALQRAGEYSTALGFNNIASGKGASALGFDNTASGVIAIALGYANTVSGDGTALGSLNSASGNYSTALGYSNTVSGHFSSALGYENTASGDKSTAIGNYVSTAGRKGAMILGDYSAFTSTSATAENQLTTRFAGGYQFFTNSGLTKGVSLAAGGTSWGTISDSTKKERFLPINGPDLLRKIGGMKLTTWNYKGQRDRRHYGPMAQEFFALFGHDALGDIGCDTLLTTQDVEGLTLSAVQALVRENEQLRAETLYLASQLRESRAEMRRIVSLQSETDTRLHLLEQALLGRKRVTLRKR
jgi:hypothetical protein